MRKTIKVEIPVEILDSPKKVYKEVLRQRGTFTCAACGKKEYIDRGEENIFFSQIEHIKQFKGKVAGYSIRVLCQTCNREWNDLLQDIARQQNCSAVSIIRKFDRAIKRKHPKFKPGLDID